MALNIDILNKINSEGRAHTAHWVQELCKMANEEQAMPSLAATRKAIEAVKELHISLQKNKNREGGTQNLDHFLSSAFKLPMKGPSYNRRTHVHGIVACEKATYHRVAERLAKALHQKQETYNKELQCSDQKTTKLTIENKKLKRKYRELDNLQATKENLKEDNKKLKKELECSEKKTQYLTKELKKKQSNYKLTAKRENLPQGNV